MDSFKFPPDWKPAWFVGNVGDVKKKETGAKREKGRGEREEDNTKWVAMEIVAFPDSFLWQVTKSITTPSKMYGKGKGAVVPSDSQAREK